MTNQPRHPSHPSTTLTSTPTLRIFISQPPPSVPSHLLPIPPSTLTTKNPTSLPPPLQPHAASSPPTATSPPAFSASSQESLSPFLKSAAPPIQEETPPSSKPKTHNIRPLALLRLFLFFSPILPPLSCRVPFPSPPFFYSPCTHTPIIPRPSSLPIPSFPSHSSTLFFPAKVS